MEADDRRAERFKQAVFDGDVPALRSAFTDHPELREVIDARWFYFDSTALGQAAGQRDRALADALIDLGADLEARSSWANGPYSPLHRLVDGADEASLALADHLVSRGARVDIHSAAGMGRADVIEQILADDPDLVSEPGPDGATPLHLAKDVSIAGLLLDHGAEIDRRCIDHESTPAMWAMQGREDITRFLLENGAKPDLFMAAAFDDVALAAEILEQEPNAIDVRVAFGHSHEHLGFGDKYTWALGGADTPAELARRRGNEAVYGFLLERISPASRIIQASRRGDPAVIDSLLAEHADLLKAMAGREMCEALLGSAEGARALLAAGANPNARDDGGATALHHTAWRVLPDIATTLLDGGADPHIRERNHDATALGWAHHNGKAEMVELLLAHDPPDLLDASWLGDADRVRELLEADPSLVDGPDGGRLSPLRSAAWNGKTEVVRVLLEFGADPSIPSPEHQERALDFARARGHDDIVALLEDD